MLNEYNTDEDLVQQNREEIREPTEKDRDFKGIWIPKAIYLNKDLSWSEKILLVEIDSLSSNENGCFATNSYFSKFLGIHPTKISEMISKLKKLGLVEQISFDGRQRIIRSCPENFTTKVKSAFTPGLRQTSPKGEGTIHQKVKGGGSTHNILINTSINTIEREHAHERDPTQQGGPPPITPTSSSKKKPGKINFREKVALTQKEHDTLLEKNGQAFLNKMLDKLNSYKCSSGKKYESDYATMHDGGWVKKQIDKEIDEGKTKKDSGNDVEKKHKYCQLIEEVFNSWDHKKRNGRAISASPTEIEFSPGGNAANSEFIKYTDPAFKEKMNHHLRKFGLI